MNYDVIRINNMVFHAFHGVEESEKIEGQRYEVDVELFLDLRKPARSDQLEDTIDYREVYEVVEEIVVEGEYNLVETMAEDMASSILDKFNVKEVLVRVRKPHVPLRGISDGVEIEIRRQA